MSHDPIPESIIRWRLWQGWDDARARSEPVGTRHSKFARAVAAYTADQDLAWVATLLLGMALVDVANDPEPAHE